MDIHTHILPRDLPDLREKYGYGGWISLEHTDKPCCANMMKDGVFFREVDHNCYNPDARIEGAPPPFCAFLVFPVARFARACASVWRVVCVQVVRLALTACWLRFFFG